MGPLLTQTPAIPSALFSSLFRLSDLCQKLPQLFPRLEPRAQRLGCQGPLQHKGGSTGLCVWGF